MGIMRGRFLHDTLGDVMTTDPGPPARHGSLHPAPEWRAVAAAALSGPATTVGGCRSSFHA